MTWNLFIAKIRSLFKLRYPQVNFLVSRWISFNFLSRGKILRTTYLKKQNVIREGKVMKRKEGNGRPRKLKVRIMQKISYYFALRDPYITAQRIVSID